MVCDRSTHLRAKSELFSNANYEGSLEIRGEKEHSLSGTSILSESFHLDYDSPEAPSAFRSHPLQEQLTLQFLSQQAGRVTWPLVAKQGARMMPENRGGRTQTPFLVVCTCACKRPITRGVLDKGHVLL